MDLGAAIKFAFDDPDWWKKCLLAGVCLFIPFVGVLMVFGWQRRIFDQVRAGQPTPLPSVDFGNDLSYGIAPFVAVLNVGVVMVVLGLGAGLGTVLVSMYSERLAGLATIFTVFSMLALGLAAAAITPELQRRAFTEGDMLPLLKPGPSLTVIREHTGDYLLVILGRFIANMLGSLGAMLCYVGMFVTTPLGLAIFAHLLAQFHLKVEAGQG